MEKILYFNELYDFYQNLLTDKQKHYFEDYYFNNLSLAEMAENYDVSRNAIFQQLKSIEQKLEDYENKLKLAQKKKQILSYVSDETLYNKIDQVL